VISATRWERKKKGRKKKKEKEKERRRRVVSTCNLPSRNIEERGREEKKQRGTDKEQWFSLLYREKIRAFTSIVVGKGRGGGRGKKKEKKSDRGPEGSWAAACGKRSS